MQGFGAFLSGTLVAKKNDFVKFPFTDAEKDENKEKFYKMGGFPSCILAVDGFHVRICTPYEDEDDFVNRKIFIQSTFKPLQMLIVNLQMSLLDGLEGLTIRSFFECRR